MEVSLHWIKLFFFSKIGFHFSSFTILSTIPSISIFRTYAPSYRNHLNLANNMTMSRKSCVLQKFSLTIKLIKYTICNCSCFLVFHIHPIFILLKNVASYIFLCFFPDLKNTEKKQLVSFSKSCRITLFKTSVNKLTSLSLSEVVV